MNNVSYALGLGIGQQLLQMGATDLNIDDFADAIKDVLAATNLKSQTKMPKASWRTILRKKRIK